MRLLSHTYQNKPNLTFNFSLFTDDIENTEKWGSWSTLLRQMCGVPGASYYVRCDVTDEDDIKVTTLILKKLISRE